MSAKGEIVVLSNDFVSLAFDHKRGAAMVSFKTEYERYEQTARNKAFATSGALPGPFRDAAFAVDVGRGNGCATAVFSQKTPSRGLVLEQTVSLADDKAEICFALAAKNVSGAVRKTDLRWHPELNTPR